MALTSLDQIRVVELQTRSAPPREASIGRHSRKLRVRISKVATSPAIPDATKIMAIFDLRDAPHGLYDVKVINPGGQEAIVPYRYLVERALEPDVTIGMGGQDTERLDDLRLAISNDHSEALRLCDRLLLSIPVRLVAQQDHSGME